MGEERHMLLPCPFCGRQPKIGKSKVRHCQLHGDRLQNAERADARTIGGKPMTADTPAPEPLGERAERLAVHHENEERFMEVASAVGDADTAAYATRCRETAATLRELAAANTDLNAEFDQTIGHMNDLTAERDALRAEWDEIAAGLTTDPPAVGELWPLVSEVSGALSASRNLFRNEIAAHNRTKTERDAALARAERLERAVEQAEQQLDYGQHDVALRLMRAALAPEPPQ